MSSGGDVTRPMAISRGDHYLLSMPMVLLLAGDALYGDPDETTPAGRVNARSMIDSIIRTAVQHGFPREIEIRQLLRANVRCERLVELAREATDLIPAQIQLGVLQKIRGRSEGG